MNFDQAITVHSNWKMKLTGYLKKPDGTLNPADIAPDNRCDLGKWIAGEGVKFSNLPQFSALKEQHTRFHKPPPKSCAAPMPVRTFLLT